MKLVVTCKQMQAELPRLKSILEDHGFEIHAPSLEGRQQFSASELIEFTSDATAIIAGDDELSDEFFRGCPDLRVLVRWGIGTDSVDFESASQHGVTVRNTPGVFNDEVADMAMSYVLALARRTIEIHQAVANGDWPKIEGATLSGATLGVVGFGGIGRAIVKRALAFGMSVKVVDPYASASDLSNFGVHSTDLETLARESRFVVLACPATEETFHLVDESFLTSMRDDAFVVNVGRGTLVDEKALILALKSSSIAGAALDVYESEPLPSKSELRALSNVIFGSHNGSNTREGVARASDKSVQVLLECLIN
ncbi:phosphoglycerate dehydrogenase [Gordonia alkanivorans]|uniref:phosphoglycerate dehydrogenase n=1 Tax=Gordonia alkanivorans TaxID=84096 RepID=UPI002447FC61|nr:phosphoglycerate dehydrogenase [Gordonia alkanivorans]MDH3052490.1 phosphoglycerate dehydrogenase [Gordonia alkanivorans]